MDMIELINIYFNVFHVYMTTFFNIEHQDVNNKKQWLSYILYNQWKGLIQIKHHVKKWK